MYKLFLYDTQKELSVYPKFHPQLGYNF